MQYTMRQSPVVLLSLCLTTFCFAQSTPSSRPFDVGLTPDLDAATLGMANNHANAALQYESQQQWVAAKDEYQQIIQQINAELQLHESQKNQMLYYFLGLANTDYARMLLNMGVNQLFVTDYVQHLNDADQSLRAALSLSQGEPVPAAQIYTAMAIVQTYQGNYAGARADVANVQQLSPNNQGAASAASRLTMVPPAAQEAGQRLTPYQRSKTPFKIDPANGPRPAPGPQATPLLTKEQATAILEFGEAIGGIFYPKIFSAVKAGVAVVHAFQTTSPGATP